jgi:hypothetical protein
MADDEDRVGHDPPPPTGALAALGNPLRVEDEEYEMVDEVGLVAVRWSSSLDDARATGQRLIEHGLGATVAPAPPVPPAGGEAGAEEIAGFEVRVLPEEAARAADVLDGGSGALAGPRGEPAAKAPVPWRKLVAIWLAAMILLPLAAGIGAYLLLR